MARRQTHDDFDPDDPDDDLDVLDEGEDADQSDTGYCPDCGAEIYDAADVCPKCFTWINGETVRHPKARRRERIRGIVVWILIGTMLLGAGVFVLRQWI